jgi:hypothetical protein
VELGIVKKEDIWGKLKRPNTFFRKIKELWLLKNLSAAGGTFAQRLGVLFC